MEEPEEEILGGAGIIEWGTHLVEEIRKDEKENNPINQAPSNKQIRKKLQKKNRKLKQQNSGLTVRGIDRKKCVPPGCSDASGSIGVGPDVVAVAGHDGAPTGERPMATWEAFAGNQDPKGPAGEAGSRRKATAQDEIGQWEALVVNQRLEPGWRRKIQGGHKLTLVMDSGAVKTIVPQSTIPGMTVKKTEHSGKYFRAANGGKIPNKGATTIKGNPAMEAR